MSTCDTCTHRTGWVTEFIRTGPQKMVIARCMHPDWPEWWKARGERPVVSPGAGSGCKKHERREPPNVEFSGVPAGHLSNHPAGGTSAGTQG